LFGTAGRRLLVPTSISSDAHLTPPTTRSATARPPPSRQKFCVRLPDSHKHSKRERETHTSHRKPIEVPHSKTAGLRMCPRVCQEALVPEVGDQIQVAATKVDQATRSGVVTDVRGRMITVQWATGDQSVFVPAPGTLTVLGRADTRPRRTTGSARASRSARRATPTRPTTTKKPLAKKTPVPKPAKKAAAKATARKAPARKTPRKVAAKATARKAPARKTAKKVAAKATARKAPARKTAKRPTAQRRTTVTRKAARSRVR
jgi:Domain of unknown function (DUF1918)